LLLFELGKISVLDKSDCCELLLLFVDVVASLILAGVSIKPFEESELMFVCF